MLFANLALIEIYRLGWLPCLAGWQVGSALQARKLAGATRANRGPTGNLQGWLPGTSGRLVGWGGFAGLEIYRLGRLAGLAVLARKLASAKSANPGPTRNLQAWLACRSVRLLGWLGLASLLVILAGFVPVAPPARRSGELGELIGTNVHQHLIFLSVLNLILVYMTFQPIPKLNLHDFLCFSGHQ